MSSSSKSRKTSKLPSRSSSKKMSNQNSNLQEGAYGNPRMVHTLFSLVMDVVLGAASKQEGNSSVNDAQPMSPRNGQLMDDLIFKSKDIVVVKFHDVKLNFAEEAVKSNGDVGLETRFPSSNGSELRTLEPWDGGGDTPIDGTLSMSGLEDGLEGAATNGTNGWGAEDMFRINKEQYGVKSSYNPDLPEYTTPLDTDNSYETELRKARATKIAQEIEGSASYAKNISLELDDSTTEEEKFSSVRRDPPPREQSKYGGRNKGRGREQNRDQGRDMRVQRPNHNYYQGALQRGSFVSGPGRSNTPTNPSESPTSPSQPKPFNNRQAGMPQAIAPRFQKGPHQREGDRSFPRNEEERGNRGHDSRLHENPSHHSGYPPNQPKPQRQPGGQRERYGRSQQTTVSQDYNQPGDNPSPLSGQNTPRSLSRNSSASSVNQQVPGPQWNSKSSPAATEERQHPPQMGAPPSGGNPPLTRNFSSGSNREGDRHKQKKHISGIPKILGRPRTISSRSADETSTSSRSGSSYSSALQSNAPAKAVLNVQQPTAGSHAERYIPPHQAYHPPMIATGVPQVPQGQRYFLTPRGHSPPNPQMTTNNPSKMHVPGVPPSAPRQVPNMPQQQQQQRFSAPSAATPPSTPVSSSIPTPTRRPSSEAKAAAALSKPSVPTATHAPAAAAKIGVSKSSSTGSSKTDIDELKEFSANFKLADSTKASIPSVQAKPATTSSSEVPSVPKAAEPASSKPTRSGSTGQVASRTAPASAKETFSSQPAAPVVQQQPSSQVLHQAPVVRHPSIEGMDMTQQSPVVFLPASMMPVAPRAFSIQESPPQIMATTTTVLPPQPSINVPSARTPSTASDVVTVSAATGPFVSPQSEAPHQQTVVVSAASQKVTTPATPIATTPSTAASTPTTSSDATAESSTNVRLDPMAKEFTPRSHAPKSTSSVPPQSPSHVNPHQPGPATYYSANGQVITPVPPTIPVPYPVMPKPQIPKPDPSVVGINVGSQMHPTTAAGHTFIAPGHTYHHHHPAPLVFAQTPGAHQQITTPGQHAVVQPQVHYQNVDPSAYSAQGHHIMQPATPRPLQGSYAADAAIYQNYQSPPQVQLQQHPSQQQQSQQHQPAQQQAQPPSNASYIQQQQQQQQQPQQQRPHSAHTPNPSHIPPTSPASNIQAQSGSNMAVNAPAPMHPPAQNAVIAASHQNYYPQHILTHHTMHGHIMPNSPHATYPMPPRGPTYMVLPPGGQQISSNTNAAGQHGFMQPVVSSATHMQAQYQGRHQFQNHPHQPQVIQGYQQPQQQPPN